MKIREKKIPGRGNHKCNGPRTANGFGMFEYRIIYCGWRGKKSKNSIFDEFEMPLDTQEACY